MVVMDGSFELPSGFRLVLLEQQSDDNDDGGGEGGFHLKYDSQHNGNKEQEVEDVSSISTLVQVLYQLGNDFKGANDEGEDINDVDGNFRYATMMGQGANDGYLGYHLISRKHTTTNANRNCTIIANLLVPIKQNSDNTSNGNNGTECFCGSAASHPDSANTAPSSTTIDFVDRCLTMGNIHLVSKSAGGALSSGGISRSPSRNNSLNQLQLISPPNGSGISSSNNSASANSGSSAFCCTCSGCQHRKNVSGNNNNMKCGSSVDNPIVHHHDDVEDLIRTVANPIFDQIFSSIEKF